jgi:transcription initiation factor TFIIA small subunit
VRRAVIKSNCLGHREAFQFQTQFDKTYSPKFSTSPHLKYDTMAAVYRNTTLGVCLIEALQEMQQQQKINDEKLIKKILFQFDKSMMEVLESKSLSKCVMKGHLHTYRFCDNTWTFFLENPVFRFDSREMTWLDSAKIVAADYRVATGEDKLTPIEPPP